MDAPGNDGKASMPGTRQTTESMEEDDDDDDDDKSCRWLRLIVIKNMKYLTVSKRVRQFSPPNGRVNIHFL